MLLTLSAPPDNERGPQYMEQALAAIHQANARRLPITFRLSSDGNTVHLSCRFPRELTALIAGQLGAHYPDSDIKLTDDQEDETARSPTWSAEVHLPPDVFPIRRHTQFEDPLNRNISDPLTSLFAALGPDNQPAFPCAIELSVVPAPPRRRRHAFKAMLRLTSPLLLSHPHLASLPPPVRGSVCGSLPPFWGSSPDLRRRPLLIRPNLPLAPTTARTIFKPRPTSSQGTVLCRSISAGRFSIDREWKKLQRNLLMRSSLAYTERCRR